MLRRGVSHHRARAFPTAAALLLGVLGCMPYPPPPSPAPPPARDEPAGVEEPAKPGRAEVSFDTPRDEHFARFVAKTAGPLVQKVAVGIERKGIVRLELGEATTPDDTLPLAKSVLAGARKDFPDRPITVAVYDPQGEPILKARYQPEEGVHYEVVRGEHHAAPAPPGEGRSSSPSLPESGTTAKDRQFADWAMRTGHRYLRYVQADLEHRGRLWFGVTRDVEPNEVSELARSLLNGARKEFPGRELTATVFDPDGERIGRATLGRDGQVHWSH